MTDNEQKLLPCPFCGIRATHTETDINKYFPWLIHCINGHCEGMPTVRGATEADVIRIWNTRPNPALDVQAEAEELMKAFWGDFKFGPRYKNGKAIGTSYSHTKSVERIAASLQSMLERGRGTK